MSDWNEAIQQMYAAPIVAEQQGGEVGQVVGYIFTHWDCECGEMNEEEGDASSDLVTCRTCASQFTVTHT